MGGWWLVIVNETTLINGSLMSGSQILMNENQHEYFNTPISYEVL